MKDFFSFRRMLAPWLIRIAFIFGLLILAITGIYAIITHSAAQGLLVLTAGPILLRLFLELIAIFFTINESLTDIRNLMKQRD